MFFSFHHEKRLSIVLLYNQKENRENYRIKSGKKGINSPEKILTKRKKNVIQKTFLQNRANVVLFMLYITFNVWS